MRPLVQLGDKNEDVQYLQLSLSSLGYDLGDIDGKFGPLTEAAVRDFQEDIEHIEVDGKVGPETWGALEQALWVRDPTAPDAKPDSLGPAQQICSDETWLQFTKLVELVTSRPIVYGPGRGLWHEGSFLITYGPGGLGKKSWKSQRGATGVGPSFHCTSWTNFVLSMLARRNEDYTHAGNIPPLTKLCETPNEPRFEKGVGTWRGFGDICVPVLTDGSSRKRTKLASKSVVDLRELWERRHDLSTFFVCGQSTKKSTGTWKWWHHTVLFVIDHRQDGSPMYRIAADGFVDKSHRWSSRPMVYTEVTESYAEDSLGRFIFRGYSLCLPDPCDRPCVSAAIEA
jgi:peptidoglycan hydrolase-like protein with peptidoglycan-binding domain